MDDFVSDIEVDFPPNVVTGAFGDDHMTEFRLGFLVQARQIVLMSVMLLEGGSFIEGCRGVFDLRFGVRLQYIDRPWNITSMDYSQAAKRRYVHPNHRETVRNLTVRAIAELTAAVRPPTITMSTADVELPPEALVKYAAIDQCLNESGYRTVGAYRSEDGRDRWHFEAAT